MDTIPEPYDKNSALEALKRFMDNAMNIKLKGHFDKAVKIIHGPCYLVKMDSSYRMLFYCVNCSKDLNNIKSLNEHATSEGHLKHFDLKRQAERLKMSTELASRYSPDSLHFKVQNSSCAIIGLEMVEVYENKRGRTYCKCILCGAHGKVEEMYKHLIGDKHTDKYIKSHRVLKSPIIKSEERKHLREMIRDEEDSFVHKIRTFRGNSLYPDLWELEAVPISKRRINRVKLVSEPASRGAQIPNSHDLIKKEPKDESTDTFFMTVDSNDEAIDKFRNPSPPPSVSGEGRFFEKNYDGNAFGVFSYDLLSCFLLKGHFIIQTHLLDDTDLYTNADFVMALKIVSYALHLLYYSNKSCIEEAPETLLKRFTNQKRALSLCLGYVHERLIPHYEKKTGDCIFPKKD